MLSDKVGQVVEAHTIHVLGASDPYIQGCLALYNICNEDAAHIFDHGKGHIVPRDPRTIKELVSFVRERVAGDGIV